MTPLALCQDECQAEHVWVEDANIEASSIDANVDIGVRKYIKC
jgi:hypothetical protein